jgi:hypothetical protein
MLYRHLRLNRDKLYYLSLDRQRWVLESAAWAVLGVRARGRGFADELPNQQSASEGSEPPVAIPVIVEDEVSPAITCKIPSPEG